MIVLTMFVKWRTFGSKRKGLGTKKMVEFYIVDLVFESKLKWL